ncbi:MAG: TonB-dependent receptor [Deltaproteobacteria bacterium]|nr:TonB-dependent receptor [Deltaproteobacteria bacterium]
MPQLTARTLCLLILMPVFGATTYAQEDDNTTSDEPQMRQEEEIVVQDTLPYLPQSNTIAARLPLSLAETPASVSVVTAPLIDEQNGRVLGDALRNVSGLNVQTGNGVFDFFVVRGLDSVSSGMILTDGAQEPESSFYQLYNVDRVEVLKGPSSFLYGGSPLGGTVNLVRKQPLPTDFLNVSLGTGSQSTSEASLDWNSARQDGSLSFRLNALFRDSDEYRDDKQSEVWAINPALSWAASERTRVHVNLEHLESEYRSDAGLPLIFGIELPDVPRTRSYQSPFDISDQQVDRLQVDVETEINDTSSLRAKLYYRSLDWFSRGTLFNGVFPTATGSLTVSRFLAELDNEQQFVGTQIEYLRTATTGRTTHNLLAGIEISRLADEFTFVPSLLPDIDLLAPVETAKEPLFPIPGQSRAADAESRMIAPYLIDQIRISDRVQLLLGARWDNIDFEEEVLDTSRDDSQFNPMLGLVVGLRQGLSLYANAGTAFAPPSTFALEADRVPEESTQYELGLKGSWGATEASLALFQLDRENIAIPDETGVSRQIGDQRAQGLEIEVSTEVARRTRLLVAYAYTDGELTRFTEQVLVGFFPPTFATVDRSGNTPAFTPEHLLNIWLSRHYDNGFGFGLGGRWVSEQYIAEDNRFEIDAYWTVDASLFYRHGPWKVSLHGKNLTGEEYLTRGFGGASVIPAQTESVFGALEYNF